MMQIAQIMLHKGKKGREDREGYRPISVTQAAYKLLALVLLDRLERETSDYVEESQAGARKHRTTLHPLTVVRLTLERLLKTDAVLAMLLIDYKQAFNAPTPKAMDDSLREAGASPKVRAIIRMLDDNLVYRTRMSVGNSVHYSRPFKATKGCPMGCPASPWRFVVLLQWVIAHTDGGKKILSEQEFSSMLNTSRCLHCYEGYKLRKTSDRSDEERVCCPACRFSLRDGQVKLDPQAGTSQLPESAEEAEGLDIQWFRDLLAEEGVALDAQQYVDDYLMMNAAATTSRALDAVLSRGKDALDQTVEISRMESQGDKCETLAPVAEHLDSEPVTVEHVRELKLPHVECPDCKSIFETHLGRARHNMYCTAASQPWTKSKMPTTGFQLDPFRPLITFRGKPEKRFWLVKWKGIAQKGHGSGLPDESGQQDWQPESNLMLDKRNMINAWFRIHPHVDKKGDNDGNNEYRCPHCNRLDFRSEANRDAHASQCDRRETHRVSKQLVKKVRLARLEKVIARKQSVVIAKKRVPRKLKVKYLGSWIAHDGSSTEEVRYRVARARKKFNSLYTLWKAKRLDRRHKCRLYTGVLAALLYGCPTWRRTEKVERAVNHAHASMMSVIMRRSSRKEASRDTQTFNVKNEMNWQSRKWASSWLQASIKTHAKRELLRFALAIRCG